MSATRAYYSSSDRFTLLGLPATLAGLAGYRELLWHMTQRQFKTLYRQSVLGYGWAFVSPLAQVTIYTFVFSTVLNRPSQGDTPFAVFLFAGLLPWIFFSTAINFSMESVTAAQHLVTRVYFPRELLPLSAVLTRLVDLGIALLVFIGLLIVYHQPVTATVLWAPPIFLIHFMFTLGLALPLAALNVFYRDIRFLVSVAISLLFFLTPIIYSEDDVPSRYQFVYDINPNAAFINAYRGAFLADTAPALDRMALAGLITVITFVFGYYLFKKLEPRFAETI